jgi:hypothetical protein
MALPGRTENQEDRLPLERALRALEDAKKSLKAFAKKGFGVEQPGIAAVRQGRSAPVKEGNKTQRGDL